MQVDIGVTAPLANIGQLQRRKTLKQAKVDGGWKPVKGGNTDEQRKPTVLQLKKKPIAAAANRKDPKKEKGRKKGTRDPAHDPNAQEDRPRVNFQQKVPRESEPSSMVSVDLSADSEDVDHNLAVSSKSISEVKRSSVADKDGEEAAQGRANSVKSKGAEDRRESEYQ